MAELCNPGCNDDQIRMYAIPCERQSATRKGGFKRFILLDCDATFTDLTSESQWEALKNTQSYIFSPPGFGKLITPETKKEKMEAGTPEEVVDEISGFEFFTKLFDNDEYTDFDFEYDLKNKYPSKTVLWLGVDNLLYHRYDWATGQNPGFGGIALEVFRNSEDDSLQTLNINAKFNTYQDGLKAFKPTQGLLDTIFDDTYVSSGGGGI